MSAIDISTDIWQCQFLYYMEPLIHCYIIQSVKNIFRWRFCRFEIERSTIYQCRSSLSMHPHCAFNFESVRKKSNLSIIHIFTFLPRLFGSLQINL